MTTGAGPTPDPGAGGEQVELNTQVPHPARVYDYLLGGKTNFAADREVAEFALAHVPELRAGARANRAFLVRVVRFLVQRGIRQFIDIGAGIPTSPNVHEVAQAVAPDTRVVYVDNDPIVLVHARALMAGPGRGETRVVQADLRDPEGILSHPDLRRVIDLAQPAAVLLVAVLHLIADEDDPWGLVARLLAPLAPGSYLAVSHGARDLNTERMAALAQAVGRTPGPGGPGALTFRDRAAVHRFFDGLELVEPGLVPVPLWRPDGEVPEDPGRSGMWAGVARKP